MKFLLNDTALIVSPTTTIEVDSRPQNVVKNIKVVQTKKVKSKYRCTITSNKDRSRKYSLHYYLINQDNRILNIANPYKKHNDAVKAMKAAINTDNTIIYILPMKIVIEGGKFTKRAEIKNPPINAYVLTAEIQKIVEEQLLVGTVFEYYSPTHGFHKWVIVKNIPTSKYVLCAIISSKFNKFSIEITPNECINLSKVSYIQMDNILSIEKRFVHKSKCKIMCSTLVNNLKKIFNKLY